MRKVILAGLAIVAMLASAGHGPRSAEGQGVGGVILPVSFSGESWQPAVYGLPGKKLGNGKITNKGLTAVLKGELDDFAKDFLPLDPGGTVYLYYDSLTSWRVATNPNGQNTVPLTGRVANDGTFWMMGTWNFGTMGSVFAVGKVKFEKGTFNAKSVTGNVYFFSEVIDTGLILKAKTGKPVAVG